MATVIEYEELRVRVREIGRNRYLVLANGPASAAAVVRVDPDNRFRASFAALLDEEFRRTERTLPAVHERVRELGERLFATLFPEPLSACLFESRRRAEQHGRRLRVRFELAPALGDLPIEILCPPPPDRRLVGDSRLSLTHTVPASGLAPGRLPTAKSRPEKFRVLVVVAPRGRHQEPSLNLGVEVRALQEALAAGPLPVAVSVETLGWCAHRKHRPTLTNLRAALARNAEMPTAVVILGHGTGGDGTHGGRVFLEHSDGSPDPVSGERLAAELTAAPNVRLVVLNLCAGTARGAAENPHAAVADELIARGIPAVVAMQADVSDAAAARFTPALFTELAANRSVDEAVAAARQDMVNPQDRTTLEWATPTLMLHQQCRHTWLFKAVMVANNNAVPLDPLAEGARAMAEVDNPPHGVVHIEALVMAARFARLLGDWSQVVRYADMGRDDHEPLDWLAQEGQLELAFDHCAAICELLADERDPRAAEELLAGLRVPEQVSDCLAGEIRLAAKASAALDAAERAAEAGDMASVVGYCDEILACLPDGYGRVRTLRELAADELDLDAGYERAMRHRESGAWRNAAQEYQAIVDRRPDGYRDAAGWLHYCHGRVAESAADLPSAVKAYESAGDVADARGRAVRCRAWQAESAEDWRIAVDCYEAAVRHGVEVGPALPYAIGRLALADHDFAGAVTVFGELPELYRDARAHCRFAEGKVAFGAADWNLVLDALHVLPPDFRQEEVSRMRGLARAHLAEDRQDWQAVVEALQDLEDDDEVGVLRATALGHLAEERGDWPALVDAYRTVPPPTAELADIWEYAKGRVAEDEGRLTEALSTYRRIAETVRDVVLRRDLVHGMIRAENREWPEAERSFGALPAEFENAGARRGYAAARAALDRADWPAVVSEADKLGDFLDAVALTNYGRARIAESTVDWPAAEKAFAECPGFMDSDTRLGYARGRMLADEGRWREALACYVPLPDDHLDVAFRRARLTELLDSFGWAETLGEADLVPDPSAAAREDFPYRPLAPFGVGPAASMAQIKDAEMRAMRENASAVVGVSALRSWKKRLGVDADLYPVRDPAGLRAALGALTDGEPDDLFQRLCVAAGDDAPLLTLLHVGREQAITAWERQLRGSPGDLTAVHCLAIAHRWAARDLDQAGAWEHARMAWQRSIGMWVTALGDDDYWERWRRERSARYQFMVPVAELRALRRAAMTELTEELHRIAEPHDRDGRPGMAESYRTLGLTVQVETLGRDVLAELGGLPASDGSRIVGGPVYLRAVGASTSAGRLVAELTNGPVPTPSEEDGPVSDELMVRLRAAFSRLAPARLLLEAGRPTRALAALPDLPYTRLADVLADPGCACVDRPGDDCPRCERFRTEDPAYACLTGRDAQLWQDSVRIAVDCYARIARDAVLGGEESGVDDAVRAIGAALDRAATVGLAGRARDVVAELVGTCVEAMTAQGTGRPQRLDRAVELVSRVRDELGVRGTKLSRAHAEALFQRAQGMALGLERGAIEYDRAIADLRLAIELNPTMLMARVGLAHTLVDRSRDQSWLRGHVAAMAEAMAVATEGLRLAPGMGPLIDALKDTAEHVRTLVYRTLTENELTELPPPESRPNESATTRAIRLARTALRVGAAGDRRHALLLGVEAVLADPSHPFPRDTLTALVTRWAADDPDGSTT